MSAYVARGSGEAGVYLSWLRSYAPAQHIYKALLSRKGDIEGEVERPLTWSESADGKFTVAVSQSLGNMTDAAQRAQVIGFLAIQTNRMVNALRPRIQAILAEQKTVGQRARVACAA